LYLVTGVQTCALPISVRSSQWVRKTAVEEAAVP
jgi:hypothetical protein